VNPGFDVQDVWLKYQVDFHRRPRTLRELVTARLAGVLRGQGDFARDDREFWALKGVTLAAGRGEVLGITGSNGAGKSTLLQVIARIMQPDRGTVRVSGVVGSLLSFGAGFNPTLSGRENVYINGALLGLTRAELDKKMDDIVELSGVGDFFDASVRTYSSGMRARLGFAVAANINPDILLIDEVVQVGDTSFQMKAGNILDRFRDQKKVIVLVTHSTDMIRRYCTRGVWMELGGVRRDGPADEIAQEYLEWSRERAQQEQERQHLPAET
jgi:ABC-type polysaccharide/polyol phosphate transport system ATPase subunit